MPQATIGCPLSKFDLGDQFGFKPHVVYHLLSRERPLGSFLLWEISERASISL